MRGAGQRFVGWAKARTLRRAHEVRRQGRHDSVGTLRFAHPTIDGSKRSFVWRRANSADVAVPKVGSHDIVYTAAKFTLPTGVNSMFLEGAATQAVGNSNVAGDTLYAANAPPLRSGPIRCSPSTPTIP